MSLEADHIELANRNHETLLYLVKEAESHPEWVATVAFYKAVQIIEAIFDVDSRGHSNGHDNRINSLKCPKYRELFRAYRPLYAASLVARYLEDTSARKFEPGNPPKKCYSRFTDYMPADRVVHSLLKKRLDVIEQHAVQFLSDAGKASLKRIQQFLDSLAKDAE